MCFVDENKNVTTLFEGTNSGTVKIPNSNGYIKFVGNKAGSRIKIEFSDDSNIFYTGDN